MDNNTKDVEKNTLSFDPIEFSDTISQFMEKCNNNFAKIISNNGGPKGDKGEQGNPGVPTKPKVSIHVWKDEVEYANEYYDSDKKVFYIDDNNIKEDLTKEKYKVGHLIILENGNVYILENSEKKLKPKFKLSLIVSADIKNQIDNIVSDLDYIKSQKNGGVNLIDRTAFEIYKNDKDDNLKDKNTYIITNKKNTDSRPFYLHNNNLKNTKFLIKDKSEYKNRIYTNSIKIDATDTTESNTNNYNYSDITQMLNYINDYKDTILKPNTVYTLYCKYKCERVNNSYVNYRGGLFITYVNTKWMTVDNVTVPPKSDLATLFHNDVTEDWKPIKITFETGSEIGQKDYKGCILHIRAMSGCWVEICELKLEEGNMQTQWSESNSDITSRIKQASSSSSVNISISNIANNTDDFYYINLNNINDPCFNSDTIIINGDDFSDNKPICILLPTDKIYNNNNFSDPLQYVSNNGKTIKIKNLSENNCFVALPSKGESGKLYQINSKIPIHDETVTSEITMSNGIDKYNSIEISNNYSEFVCFNNNIWCQTK